MLCSLCNGRTRAFGTYNHREYLQCLNCKAILLHDKHYPSPKAEKSRYRLHENDVEDQGYISFVKPLVKRISQDFSETSHGLDFGCGTGPVAANELKKHGFRVKLYDPFFKPKEELLQKEYDYIICCEVMEHFHEPASEFALLISLLKENGKLYCKTSLWDDSVDFENWYYKNDLTHVIFYHRESLGWIKENFGFGNLEISADLIVFEN